MNHEEISSEKINEIRQALSLCREFGFSVLLRPGYHFFGYEYDQPKEFTYIMSHAQQLVTVLNSYADIILGMQAGFIGPYGEWHNSRYMDNDEDGIPFRIKLLRILDQTLDSQIAINIRRPMFIREAADYGISTQRIGIHNDALLSTDTDMGTYVDNGFDRNEELQWMENELKTQVNGGETTNISEYTSIETAVKEFDMMNLTYLNRYYNQDVLNSWKEQMIQGVDGYTYIKNHLGYRLSINEIVLPETVGFMQSLKIQVNLHNSGFARPSKAYQPYLAIRINDQILKQPLVGTFNDENSWKLQGEVKLPFGEEPTTVKVGFQLIGTQPIVLANDDLEYQDEFYWITEYVYNENLKKYQYQDIYN